MGLWGLNLGTGSFFMELMPQRNVATLTPFIQRNILPGSTVSSADSAEYNPLNTIGYVHQTVNHSQHYVDPSTGIHTDNTEVCRSACKASFKQRFSIAREHLL